MASRCPVLGPRCRASDRPAVPFLNLPIAEYGLLEQQGIRVYYFPADKAGAERVLERSLQALRLLSDWFGPLDSQPRFAIMEIPEGWGSQADLAGGIIQTASAFRASYWKRRLATIDSSCRASSSSRCSTRSRSRLAWSLVGT